MVRPGKNATWRSRAAVRRVARRRRRRRRQRWTRDGGGGEGWRYRGVEIKRECLRNGKRLENTH